MRQIIGGIVAALSAAVGSTMPHHTKELAWTAFWFIVMDTLAGVWLAFVARKVRSRSVITMLVSKLVQYAILLILCSAGAALADSWAWLNVGLMAVMSIESLSMLETLTQLQRYGVDFGPVNPLLERLRKYFAVNDDAPGSAPVARQDE